MSESSAPMPKPTLKQEHAPMSLKITGLFSISIVTLKLIGVNPVASWSWWWILSPFWIIGTLSILVLLGTFAIFFFFDR